MKKLIETFRNIFKIEELRKRIVYTLLLVLVYRLGCFVVIPGIDATMLATLQNNTQEGLVGLLNMFSGGAFGNASIFALGVMPYISASIVIQLLGMFVPYFKKLQMEGESGRKRINQITRYLTVVILAIQCPAYLAAIHNQIPGQAFVAVTQLGWSNFTFNLVSTIVLLAGSMFVMWLGERITDRGIGNGISLIIFAGIVAGLPSALARTFEQSRQGDLSTIALLIIGVVVVLVTFFVVFVERGQRKIVIEYAKRQMGNRIYSQPRSNLPLKINLSGVIPAIFASSIILFPGTVVSWFGQGDNAVSNVLGSISVFLQPGQPLYELLYAAAIIFFTFFYTALVFNPREIADNLKKGGAFIPGIRPGKQTARFIDKVMTRLTLSGSLYMVLVCLVPQMLMNWFNVQFYFGGTSLLIIVVVCMDFVSQLQSHMMNQQYGDIMRKANLRNYGR